MGDQAPTLQNHVQAPLAVKSQAIADFIIEWTESYQIPQNVDLEYWLIYFDGSMIVQGLGAGVVLISSCGNRMSYVR